MKNQILVPLLSFILLLYSCERSFPDKTKERRTVKNMLHLKDSAVHFREVYGYWPKQQKSLLEPPHINGVVQNKFISKEMRDAWGRVILQEIGEQQEPVFVSLGSDGKPGGVGLNKDIRFSVLDRVEGE